jgi:hypothetical protein
MRKKFETENIFLPRVDKSRHPEDGKANFAVPENKFK